ncbi:MAG: hypothetical protein QY316_10780 [Thermodesulfobacteriota bacterium]|nr:MAG: hypothetical protein QY316_10780 [Thermodesulfobacteriota bacterium]
MRETYSTHIALLTGFLILVVTAAFALIQNPGLSALDRRSAPYIPHGTDGKENCLACHGHGATSPYPQKHLGWKEASCTRCHVQAARPEAGPEPDANPAPPAGASAAHARPVPHPFDGYERCFGCHHPDTGMMRAPSDHRDRPEGGCSGCHADGL